MKHKSATLIVLMLSLSVLDCTGHRQNSSSESTSVTSTAAKTQASALAASLPLTKEMAQSLTEVMTSDRQTLLGLQKQSCVKLDYSLKSEIQENQIFHVDCTVMDGTIEVLWGKNDDGQSYDITTDLTYNDDGLHSRVDNSFYSVKILSDKSEHIIKDFEESYTAKAIAYEMNGTSNYVFTPDGSSEDPLAGTVEIESTVYFSINKEDLTYFDVSTFALHKSSCGLDRGAISFSNNDVTYQITYSGCGNFKMTESKATTTTAGFF